MVNIELQQANSRRAGQIAMARACLHTVHLPFSRGPVVPAGFWSQFNEFKQGRLGSAATRLMIMLVQRGQCEARGAEREDIDYRESRDIAHSRRRPARWREQINSQRSKFEAARRRAGGAGSLDERIVL